MFEPTSRYHKTEVKTRTDEAGNQVRYVARRFLPDPSAVQVVNRVQVAEGTRLDLLAHQHLGEATQFWRIADANRAMWADDLVATPGRTLSIPGPDGMPMKVGEV